MKRHNYFEVKSLLFTYLVRKVHPKKERMKKLHHINKINIFRYYHTKYIHKPYL